MLAAPAPSHNRVVLLTAVLVYRWCMAEASCPAPSGAVGCAYYYDGIGNGDHVSDLTSSAIYPDSPTGTATITSSFQSSNSRTNCGDMLRTFFIAPSTGKFVFILKADDAGEVWVQSAPCTTAGGLTASFTGVQSAGFTLAVAATYSSGETTGVVEYDFVAGMAYFVQALMKQGGGGYRLKVIMC